MTVEPYQPIYNVNQWHDVYTLQLGECIEAGIVDFSSEEYNFNSYDADQRKRVYDLITNKYYFFELGIMPVKVWRIELINTLNLEMLQVRRLYEMIAAGYDPLNSESEWYKSRHVFSDFPQTRLSSKNQDYASTANDKEYELIRTGDELERYIKYAKDWKHPDNILVDAVKTCFYGLVTCTIPLY